MKISIQGQKASFHDIAQKQYYNNGHDVLHRGSFADVFKDVSSGQADAGVVAIENSLYGSINKVYDLLLENQLKITGEIYLRIKHNLLGVKGADVGSINEVYSHPVALAQCETFLKEHLPNAKQLDYADTAASAENVAHINSTEVAAIASSEAAKLYGLEIIQAEVETNKQNYTRFVVIEKEPKKDDNDNKTSIILEVAEKAGSLHNALGAFANSEINLIKLESRPVIGKAWHYIFYIDFEAGWHEDRTQKALEQLKSDGHSFTLLGSYKQGRAPLETT